jgi:nicotinate-nucleotide pyrophosphorylase (carboxylating)
MTFSATEIKACRRLVELALEEDLGAAGDVTSEAIIPAELNGKAVFVARAPGVLAGLPAVQLVLAAVDSTLSFEALVEDGALLKPGDRLATTIGRMRAILAGERTALNFVQRLSGIATETRKYVDKVASLPCRILDTRKTTPGWRLLEKYAVRCGGGHNHRTGLYDAILIKDNHLGALANTANLDADVLKRLGELIRPGIEVVSQHWERGSLHARPIEIEVDNLEQFEQVLACRPNIILLDNMPLDDLREAVRRRKAIAPQVQLEASGGVNLDNVRAIAETGVDRISVGALTHSAPALDIGLDYEAS